MSFYSNLKEIYKDTTQIIQGKDSAGKIVYLLKTLSFVTVCLLYLMEKCGLKAMISPNANMEIGLSQEICDFLSLYIFKIIGAYFSYFLVLKPIIKIISVELKTRWDKDIFPLWYTAEDIFEIFFHSTILLKVVQDTLQCINGGSVMQDENLLIYAFIVIGALFRFISKVYMQNENRWYYNTIRYTDYFDSDGKRIAKEDRVVYRNKIYELYNEKGTWYLLDSHVRTDIKLENAVMDTEGKIKVYFFSMGRRNEND